MQVEGGSWGLGAVAGFDAGRRLFVVEWERSGPASQPHTWHVTRGDLDAMMLRRGGLVGRQITVVRAELLCQPACCWREVAELSMLTLRQRPSKRSGSGAYDGRLNSHSTRPCMPPP